MSRMSRLVAALRRLCLPAAPRAFPERLAAAIAREEGVLLRVAALERSLGAPGRHASPNQPNQE